VLTKRPGQTAAIIGMAVGVGTVAVFRGAMAWPWYVPLGTLITFAVGSLVGVFTGSEEDVA